MKVSQYSFIGEKVMPLIQRIGTGKIRYNFILIKAGTGKGKTTFVLEELLDYAIERGEKILYLVNRTALKKQIEKRVIDKAQRDPSHYKPTRQAITIETYASLEKTLCKCPTECQRCQRQCKFCKPFFEYIIMDEDHYFYSDALFNTNTWLSFEWLMLPDSHVTKIGMSATPEDVHEYIQYYVREKYNEMGKNGRIFNYPLAPSQDLFRYAKPHFYFLGNYDKSFESEDTTVFEQKWDADYSYIKPHVFCSDTDIPVIVDRIFKKEKILIFVDSIQRGKEINKLLKNFGSEFVDSSYRDGKNIDMLQNVQEIVKKEQFSSRILITTATLDNGINLTDISCRHIMIMTDERTSFLQMLGRKRILPDETVHIYIHVGDVEHLKKRKGELQRILNLYNNSYNMGSWQFSNSIFQEKLFDISLVNKLYFWDSHLLENSQYEYAPAGFRLNQFSYMHACNKVKSLERIIDGMEQDSEYFTNEQLSWLGLSPDSAEMVKSIEEKMKEKKAKLDRIFEEMVKRGGDFDKRNKDEFIDSIADDLMFLYWHDLGVDSPKPKLKNGVKDINGVIAKTGLPYQFKEMGNKNAERKNKYKIDRLK